MDKVNIGNRVINVISETMFLSIPEVRPDSHLAEDLGADSIDHVEIFMNIEKEFNMSIPDEECEKLLTVNSIIDYVARNVK